VIAALFRHPALARRVRNPYLLACAGTIALWLIAWLVAVPNLYGWLVDDEDTFYRFQTYLLGGTHLFDIQWFHAYMWLLMAPPAAFRWTIPSHVAARAFAATPQLRALIVYTIVLHAVVLALVAAFLGRLVRRRSVAFAAFLIIATSPTLTFFTPLLDSRYLSLLAALPALLLLLRGAARERAPATARSLFLDGFLPGLLIALAEDIHYECLYLVVPFSVVYWIARLVQARAGWPVLAALLAFVGGLAAWIVPVQLLSLLYQPFPTSYIGMLLGQYAKQLPPYTHLENLRTWVAVFGSEMGWPFIVAAAAGAVLVAFDRTRPAYVRRFDARLMVACMVIFGCYLLASSTFPFFRMSFGYQLFYAACACVCIERISTALAPRRPILRRTLFALALLGIAFVPTFERSPEVYTAQQGYGKAVNLAYRLAPHGHVRFIVTFDDDDPGTVIDRDEFDRLAPADVIVTYFPESFTFKYPDLFALMHDTVPAGSFPTLWCTREMWSQVPSFYGGRRWADEPDVCQSRVYRVADLRRAAGGPPLRIVSVHADSTALPYLGPRRALALRTPSNNWFGAELWNPYWDLWVSKATPGTHWLSMRFAEPARIGTITLVPPDFRVPPDFLWHGRKRVDEVRIVGVLPGGATRTLWTGTHLQDDAVIDARFTPTLLAGVRFELRQSPGPNPSVGLKYVRFPGFTQTTAWNDVDPPGRPPPGR
jgi:hypothetical protein